MLWHVVLPVTCLVYGGFAVLSKQTRAAMLDNFNMDYVRTAKAKGVSYKDTVFKHVFRNSLLPLITMFVSIFPAMLAGSVVIERIFTIPGMGNLVIESINLKDRELLLANTMMIAAVNLLALLLADILYSVADPRISYK
jgi:peptide/nickel transport system permease protein